VYFSEIGPDTFIAPHCGVTNVKLRVQLALTAPAAGERCAMRVADRTISYWAGQAFVFDDSFVHAVENASAATRVVLLVDVWHPDLPARPQRAIPWGELGLPPADQLGGIHVGAAAAVPVHQGVACPSARLPLALARRDTGIASALAMEAVAALGTLAWECARAAAGW
jgi:hypothetical protein